MGYLSPLIWSISFFGDSQEVIEGHSQPHNGLWQHWYIISKIGYIIYKIWYIFHKIWYIMKDVPNFVNDVPRVPKCIPRWGSTPNHFLMGSKMKSTIHIQRGVSETIGSDVPNLMKNVPNFVKDVPSIPKCIPRWGSTPNHFFKGSK